MVTDRIPFEVEAVRQRLVLLYQDQRVELAALNVQVNLDNPVALAAAYIGASSAFSIIHEELFGKPLRPAEFDPEPGVPIQ